MSALDALTDKERDTLSQLQAITEGADMDTQISLLQSVDWDLQAALQAIYGDERAPASSSRHHEETYPEPTRQLEPLEVDDSMVFDNQARPPSYAFPRRIGTGVGIFYWLKAPFSITLNIFATLFHFIFRVLRIPFPRVNTLSLTLGNRPKRRGSHSDDPSVVAERWVRDLEEETGAVCISKAALMDAQAEDSEPGPSSRPVRRHPVKTKTLPDFFLGGYDAAVRAAQNEARVLCVIITSEEHDDCPAFRREVLTDTEFVHALTDNQIITWGGDTRDRDGYQAALKLGATTYPFVAFLSLYARSHGPDKMTVITRHSGSPDSITSASALTGHVTNTVLPRVAPVLNRKRAEQQARLSERRLREEQDRAYEESQRKDRERILKRREEERREREEEERLRQEAEEREILLASAAAERYRQAREKMAWRRYARRLLVPTENPASKTAVRIGFRIPSGKLVVRKFEPTDSVTSLYAFVASQFIPESDLPEDDPVKPPSGEDIDDLEDHDWDWEFRLASTFPKSIVPWKQGERVCLGDVPTLKGGASLVVEMMRPIETGESTEEEDDETASEDSE
ncbi:hypothetical protein CPB86DRAFT_761237 [Serendipita vermifera]|nr:hypothetical protein CPB86DRAFT_761237 [Serendipita vermifera]